MPSYEFTLRFGLPKGENHTDALVERLFEVGCNDALIGTGRPGRIALCFCRKARSATDAISSAIADVKQAIPNAKLLETIPEPAGPTRVADMTPVRAPAPTM